MKKNLLTKIKKWLGTWWGDYCRECGSKMVFNKEKWQMGYGIDSRCMNKECKNFNIKFK